MDESFAARFFCLDMLPPFRGSPVVLPRVAFPDDHPIGLPSSPPTGQKTRLHYSAQNKQDATASLIIQMRDAVKRKPIRKLNPEQTKELANHEKS